jgi:hypothetical protein
MIASNKQTQKSLDGMNDFQNKEEMIVLAMHAVDLSTVV